MTVWQQIKYSMSKLITECFGTFLLTMLYIGGSQVGLILGLWIITIFAWKISGAQMNPAITLAYMIRRDKDADHMSKTLGVCYILAQLAGAVCGSLMMSFMLWGIYDLRPNPSSNENIFGAIMQEGLGTLILVQFYLMQTDERMHYSKEPAINCFIISSSYNAARAIFNGVNGSVTFPYGACLNPAIAVGITLTSIINNGGKAFTYVWIYPVMPFAGAIGAWAFYEFIYKKTQMMLDHTRAEHDEEVHDDMKMQPDEDDGVLDQ